MHVSVVWHRTRPALRDGVVGHRAVAADLPAYAGGAYGRREIGDQVLRRDGGDGAPGLCASISPLSELEALTTAYSDPFATGAVPFLIEKWPLAVPSPVAQFRI